jgi:hypothetical protein
LRAVRVFGVSHLAWCLRCTAAHSLVTMPALSEPEAEEMAHRDVAEGAVRLIAMQVNGDACDRDVGQRERCQNITPPR